MPKPMSSLGWVSVMLTCASRASAFQSARGLHSSLPTDQSLRSSTTVIHANDIFRSDSSPFSTRLKYSYQDSSEEATAPPPLRWLNTILPSHEHDEQESVDEYLEFLDRRYRRLHGNEEEESNKPFSALNWLKQGSPSRNDLIASQQQEEDALFVLGVAGLASQKLLQKHHLAGDEKKVEAAHAETFMQILDADIVQTAPASSLIRKVLVPFVRFLYVAQRRRDMFLAAVAMRSRNALRSVARALVYGPAASFKALLEFGGGKRNMTITFAAACTMLVLMRPVIQAAVTEGTVSP